MSSAIRSLIAAGTKLWLDSIDPELVSANRALGATGATSNPIIVADLIKSGRFDARLEMLLGRGLDDESIAWEMTDRLVGEAQKVFLPVWRATAGDDGYVSFELDPLIEDPGRAMPHDDRVAAYVELGKKWAAGQENRLIKVPATPAGLAAIEELAAAGVPLNVTLIFSARQYRQARDAAWRGALRRASLDRFKTVYSVFVSRIDVYTKKHVPALSPAAQGQAGIVAAQRIWRENRQFWQDKHLPLSQEIVFASTGTKDPAEDPCKYVIALAGSDIMTNPPATNDAVARSGRSFTRQVDRLPPQEVLDELDAYVDEYRLERTLVAEGVDKFASPQRALIALIAEKRHALAAP